MDEPKSEKNEGVAFLCAAILIAAIWMDVQMVAFVSTWARAYFEMGVANTITLIFFIIVLVFGLWLVRIIDKKIS